MAPLISSSSPRKPRLLWRGTFHLRDGVALPGLAIVSTTQPAFGQFHQDPLSSPSSARPADDSAAHAQTDQEGPATGQAGVRPGFRLTKEQQDELCLSIEMVRHAPLRIVDVLEDVETDEHGTLCITSRTDSQHSGTLRNRSSSSSALTTMASTSNIHISFEIAGDVRLYIDPEQHSTVAYFERLFTYGDLEKHSGQRETCETSTSERSDKPTFAKTAIIFSLDKLSSTTIDEASDSFADVMNAWAPLRNVAQGDATMEAVIVGISRRPQDGSKDSLQPQDSVMELHVGRRITRRAAQVPQSDGVQATSSNSLFPQSALGASSAYLSRPARPDDPAPRAFARFLPRVPSAPSQTTMLRARRTSDFILPAPPPPVHTRPTDAHDGRRGEKVKRKEEKKANAFSTSGQPTYEPSAPHSPLTSRKESSSSTKRRTGNHTPGRRGEKRPRTSENADLVGVRASSVGVLDNVDQSEEGDQLSSSIGTLRGGASKRNDAASSSLFEERNRSLIKKLVHYQLLGKGVERHDDAYSACFGPTCQGALVALRKTIKIESIDKQVAAGIVERHLDMYL